MQLAYEDFVNKIVNLQSDVSLFSVEFLDRDGFKGFVDNLRRKREAWHKICITGYFSETIRKSLESFTKDPSYNIRLICPFLDIKKPRDRKNLQVLRKLANAGAEIKVNDRLHARFLVAYNPVAEHPYIKYWGYYSLVLLILALNV